MTINHNLKTAKVRSEMGQLASLLVLTTILAVLLSAALAADSVHMHCARVQLQNAADAAALAGALQLDGDGALAQDRAFQVASACVADGRLVGSQSKNTNVNVIVVPSTFGAPGKVEVLAQMYVSHFLMPIMGRAGDWIRVRSVAGPSCIARQCPHNTCFPLAVSWDTVPNGNKDQAIALSQMHIGDTFRLYINSQKYKNAAFTSFTKDSANAHYIRSAINQILQLEPQVPGLIPSVSVGDNINLNNGVVGQKKLATSPEKEALLALNYIILPAITGDPPFNQARQIIGFIAFDVTAVEVNKTDGAVETITGILKKVAIASPASGPQNWAPIDRLSVQAIKLLE